MQEEVFQKHGSEETVATLNGALESIVTWADINIRRIAWTNEEILQKFGKRSASQILSEGHTCYMNPCLDLTLATIPLVKARGFEPILVVEELIHPVTHQPAVHFAIEAGNLYLDYSGSNRVIIGEGKYQNARKSKSLSLRRFDGKTILPSEDICQIMGINSLYNDSGTERYSFHENIQRLIRDNTSQTWHNYIFQHGLNSPFKIAHKTKV